MLRKLPRQAARASFVIVVGALCPILHGAAQPWFEPNRGQLQRPIAFTARAQGYTVAFHSDGSATYVLGSTGSPEIIHMKLLGAPGRVSVSGSGALASVTRYYRDTAFFEIPHYSGISYRGIYKDIDLLWHARGADLEYEFQLAAGADPQALRLAFTGGKRVAVDPSGDLVVTTASGELRYRNPEGWQESGGQRLPVSVSFQLHSGTVRFAVGPHDIKLPLVIDPVLKYSTYLGGSGNDAAYAVATDSAGNVYTTGETASYDFPPAVGSAVRGAQAVFITKLSADESQVLFTTILVSSANSAGRSLALDGSGNIWVAGIVGGIGFPATANALNRISNGGQDAFVAELDPTGKLSYATYFGGAGTDAAMGIAVDTTGVYLTGYTASTNFPVTPGAPQASFQGGFYDAFISKLNPTGSAMLYSTYLGGTGNDTAAAIAVDVRGDACIAGRTDSPSLPLSNAIQAYAGDGDILLACLNPPGNGWSMLTYLGGSGADEANALALDSAGNIYLTGDTFSQDFPVTAGAYQTVSAGNYDAFALKLTSGNTIAFSTLLGGVGADSGTAIAVDAAGTVWLAGYTSSPNFPATMPPNFGGVFDGFIAALAPNGNSLLVASYLGGAGDDRCLGMVLSPAEEPVLVGSTGSVNFPVTAGVVQSTAPVPYNGFVSQWRLSPTVSIDTPVAGSVISGMVTISGWAIDNTATAGTAISSVQVLVDGTLVGNATYRISRPDVCNIWPRRAGCPNVGYTYQLNAANLSPGSHTITVSAANSDVPPDVGSASVQITVPIPSSPPAVWIDTPVANSTLSGTVTVSGWALDNAAAIGTAISKVQVLIDGKVMGTASYGLNRADVCNIWPGRPGCPNVGYTYQLNTATLTPGPHTLSVSATDTDATPDVGSASLSITVPVPPSVWIDTPVAGATISGTVTISGWALDNTAAVGTAISKVQVLVDGVVVGNASYGLNRADVCNIWPGRPGCPNVGYSYQLNTSALAPGSHTITVSATDSDPTPDVGSASRSITVPVPPSVWIDSPVAGATISGMVTISGWAIDNTAAVGTAISKVQVLVDGVVVGNASYGLNRADVCNIWPGRPGCPNVGYSYQLNTNTLSSGSHTITVSATDSDPTPDVGSANVIVSVQ